MSSLLVRDIIKMAEKQLNDAGVEDAKVEAEIIYCYLKKVDRARFFLEWSEMADDRTCDLFFQLIAERCKRIPLQHITGTQEFMGLPFKVRTDVLIPRMDTETVVIAAGEFLKGKSGSRVLDLCCGSGIIGITLAKKFDVKVTATDINDRAVNLTMENAKANGVKIQGLVGNLYDPVKKKKYNMIIANPPYIESKVVPTLMPEVKDHEPEEALDGGVDGLDFYRKIIDGAPEHLKKEGILAFEIGYNQGETVSRLIEETEKFFDIKVEKDLDGRERSVTARLLGKRKSK